MGEHFYDATDSLNGDQWDGVMNYAGFATPVLAWFHGVEHRLVGREVVRDAPLTTDELVVVLAAFRAAIPWAVARCQYDLLGSHDTARSALAARRHGERPRRPRAAARVRRRALGSCTATRSASRARTARTGGGRCRGTRPTGTSSCWPSCARSSGSARARAALQSGGFQVLEAGADSLAFLRDTDDEQAIVVVARGSAARAAGALDVARGAVADGTVFVEAISGARATVADGRLELPAMDAGAAIWTTA